MKHMRTQMRKIQTEMPQLNNLVSEVENLLEVLTKRSTVAEDRKRVLKYHIKFLQITAKDRKKNWEKKKPEQMIQQKQQKIYWSLRRPGRKQL